jgi:hypothetical protein
MFPPGSSKAISACHMFCLSVTLLAAILLNAAFVPPSYAAQSVVAGSSCTQLGATALNTGSSGINANTEVLACLNDSQTGHPTWERASTSVVNLNTIPAVPPNQTTCLAPSILAFDGTNFTCSPPLQTCGQGQAITTYDGKTLTCVNVN